LRELKRQQRDNEKTIFLHFSNVGPDVTSRDIWVAFKALQAGQRYVDYDKEKKEGYLRFSSELQAQETIQKVAEQKLQIGGQEIVVRLASVEEQEQCLTKMRQDAHQKFLVKKQKVKEPEVERPPKRQKKDNAKKFKEIKEKGRKVGNISNAKPKQHIIFNDDN